jgi:ribose 5-phosphate isomerase A
MSTANPKQIAAERAVSYVQDGMTVGLGTRSTAAYAIAALGQRVQTEGLRLRALATSVASAQLAQSYGIPLGDWQDIHRFDITIDGADEVDPQFRLIKGGGGALVREKLAAVVSDVEIIVVDDSKVKAALGASPLPVAVVPFAWQSTQARLESRFGCPIIPRRADGSDELFLSDDGLYVLDMAFGAPLPDPDTLEREIKCVTGVVEVGLFVGLCQRLIIGYPDGHIEERIP